MGSFDLSGALRRIRRTADLSQRELAAACGVSASALAKAEARRRGLPVDVLERAAAVAGLRLALLDAAGTEVAGMADGTVRDRAGRHFPAHLDTRHGDDDWWHGPERYSRRPPTYTFDRDRAYRDAGRRAAGIPADHQLPLPGDGLEARAAARRQEAWQRQQAEWERRRRAGELGDLPEFTCSCPTGCSIGPETGPVTRASIDEEHVPDCACRCDLG
ncbi:helix-turn-helix domain-containing protein [Modestobacter lapidis]|nr:helix-turn-helix transcriptional regulator [Modestobacter lapidis]